LWYYGYANYSTFSFPGDIPPPLTLAPPTNTPTPPADIALSPTNTPEPQQAAGKVIVESVFYDDVVARVESDEYTAIVNVGNAPTKEER
jgi:hypothetical protein